MSAINIAAGEDVATGSNSKKRICHQAVVNLSRAA
jgi:hypothetical protein